VFYFKLGYTICETDRFEVLKIEDYSCFFGLPPQNRNSCKKGLQ